MRHFTNKNIIWMHRCCLTVPAVLLPKMPIIKLHARVWAFWRSDLAKSMEPQVQKIPPPPPNAAVIAVNVEARHAARAVARHAVKAVIAIAAETVLIFDLLNMID